MDGAHNAQKLETLVASIKHDYPKQKMPVLVSFVTTKQARISQCIEALLPISQQLIITSFHTAQNERVSVDPLKVAEVCESLGYENWTVVDNPEQAYDTLLATDASVCLVTGSFYLLNHIR